MQLTQTDFLIGGDFNTNLDSNDTVASYINTFCTDHLLARCDDIFPSSKVATYVNEALNQQSAIDYIITSSPAKTLSFDVFDPDVNFSDHLPLIGSFQCSLELSTTTDNGNFRPRDCTQLRWDHADVVSYYNFTRCALEPILERTDIISSLYAQNELLDYKALLNQVHNDIVDALISGANRFVPRVRKNIYKFWWDQEAEYLKTASIESNRLWKEAGQPKHGPIFNKRQSCRSLGPYIVKENS